MGAYLSLSGMEGGGGGPLFEAGRLLNLSAFRMGAYSRWALIRGWALIRINTVISGHVGGHVDLLAQGHFTFNIYICHFITQFHF